MMHAQVRDDQGVIFGLCELTVSQSDNHLVIFKEFGFFFLGKTDLICLSSGQEYQKYEEAVLVRRGTPDPPRLESWPTWCSEHEPPHWVSPE